MNKKDLRIIFLGTPLFAVEALKALLKNKFNIVAVITSPDKPAGRGLRTNPSAVKEYASQQGLKILQPEKLKDPAFLEELRSFRADIQVVVAFRMLPEVVWNMPKYGTINIHASLLPDYRGAAPINHAIIRGEKETGVTTFQLKHEIDTGHILLQHRVPIGEDINAGDLHDILSVEGGKIIVETLEQLLRNELSPKKQDPLSQAKTAPKIFKENCKINWSQDGKTIYNFIRGLAPYPCAYAEWNGQNYKIFKASFEASSHRITPGQIITDNKSYAKVACTNGYLQLLDIQKEGKKRAKIAEFLKGNKL